jgi:tRNA(fMet)-specific endonuclease VapC
VFTSAINVGELIYGALRVNRVDLLARIQEVLDVLPAIPFDTAAAEVFGRLKADLEHAGTPLAEPDLRIAAVALTHDLTLVSGNARHFGRVPGLVIENWIE